MGFQATEYVEKLRKSKIFVILLFLQSFKYFLSGNPDIFKIFSYGLIYILALKLYEL